MTNKVNIMLNLDFSKTVIESSSSDIITPEALTEAFSELGVQFAELTNAMTSLEHLSDTRAMLGAVDTYNDSLVTTCLGEGACDAVLDMDNEARGEALVNGVADAIKKGIAKVIGFIRKIIATIREKILRGMLNLGLMTLVKVAKAAIKDLEKIGTDAEIAAGNVRHTFGDIEDIKEWCGKFTTIIAKIPTDFEKYEDFTKAILDEGQHKGTVLQVTPSTGTDGVRVEIIAELELDNVMTDAQKRYGDAGGLINDLKTGVTIYETCQKTTKDAYAADKTFKQVERLCKAYEKKDDKDAFDKLKNMQITLVAIQTLLQAHFGIMMVAIDAMKPISGIAAATIKAAKKK